MSTSETDQQHWTLELLGVRYYAQDGRDGPLTMYSADPWNDTEWIGCEHPCDLHEWR